LPERATILLVDDEAMNIEVLAALLAAEYDVVFATDGPRALALAETMLPDLILLDVMMPGMSGYEVCTRLKGNTKTAEIPVIFATILGDRDAETRGLELGAVDYVTKPINPPTVRVRVRNHVELKRGRDELRRLATTDTLTSLANRRCFDDRLRAECERQYRSHSLLSLVFIDVDHFKAFNDTYGHPAGDACLRQIGAVLAASMRRSTDLAARYGGEEFTCILPVTDRTGALDVAERIAAEIARLGLPHTGSPVSPHVTASQGVITAPALEKVTAAQLVRAADQCLYRAKGEGRNRIVAEDWRIAPDR
jgi:diguanylate cyclase (GGDEF)-like protein